MPSYLSSTQTSGPRRRDDLGGVLGRRGEHELERMEQGQLGVVQAVVAGQLGEPADVAGQHAGPLHVVERAVEGLGDGRLDEALAQADPQLAAEDLDDALGRRPDRSVRAGRGGGRPCAAGPEAASIAANAAATSGSVGEVSGGGAWPAASSTSSTARPRSEWRS